MSNNLTGMHAATGQPLSGTDHLRQSILDILMTRRGERVMRPTYGSRLHEFVDLPVNAEFLVDLYFECVVTIHRWEPRVRVVRVQAGVPYSGLVVISLVARVDGELATIEGIEVPL